ncbi:MAG: cytidine deaminase [Bacteroidia bacterium]|nr:cytidine deaminase [Bacteroidia bacterium]
MNTTIKTITTQYQVFANVKALSAQEQELFTNAKQAATQAYAPYSLFNVGCALLLDNGKIVLGNNQENAAYPSAMCAERVAVFSASALYPTAKVVTVFLSAFSPNYKLIQPITPCGSCRQALAEYEYKQKQKIKVYMTCDNDEIWMTESVFDLLPLAFNSDSLKGK